MYWTTFKKCDFELEVIEKSVAVNDLIYSFKGDNCAPLSEPIHIYILNTKTLEWSSLFAHSDINVKRLEVPEVPVTRYGHTVVAFGEKIYLWGGTNRGGVCNTLYCFDTKTLNWSRPQVTGIIPSSRYFHSACISNDECKMYILGGFEQKKRQLLHDVHCLDLKTMIWSNIITTGKIPPRQICLTAVVDNRIYLHGGYVPFNRAYATDTMYLDLKSNQWHHPKTFGNIPGGTYHRSLFVHNNIIYVFGAEDDSDNNLHYLDTKRNYWNLINPRGRSPIQRKVKECIVIRDKMFLLGSRPDKRHIRRGVFRNTINVLDFNPSLEILAMIQIVENGLDFSCLPTKLRSQIHDFKLGNI